MGCYLSLRRDEWSSRNATLDDDLAHPTCTDKGLHRLVSPRERVGSYPTISPLPPNETSGLAVYFLLHLPSSRLGSPCDELPAFRCLDFPPTDRRSATALTCQASLKASLLKGKFQALEVRFSTAFELEVPDRCFDKLPAMDFCRAKPSQDS